MAGTFEDFQCNSRNYTNETEFLSGNQQIHVPIIAAGLWNAVSETIFFPGPAMID